MVKRLFLLILLTSIVSCKADIPKDIVGYWEGEGIRQDIEFGSDGAIEIIDHNGSTYTGRYEITDGNILTCEMDQMIFTEPIVKTVKLRGDTLTLLEKSRKEVYRRQE